MPWTVLADPEGNLFRVLEPRSIDRDTGPIAAVVVNCADPRAMARVLEPRLQGAGAPGAPAGSVGLSPDVLSAVAGFGVARTGVEGFARGWLLAARGRSDSRAPTTDWAPPDPPLQVTAQAVRSRLLGGAGHVRCPCVIAGRRTLARRAPRLIWPVPDASGPLRVVPDSAISTALPTSAPLRDSSAPGAGFPAGAAASWPPCEFSVIGLPLRLISAAFRW